MKNSNENLMEGTWLLTFLQHQNAIFYNQNLKIFYASSAPLATPRRGNLLQRFRGLCVNSATSSKSATFAIAIKFL